MRHGIFHKLFSCLVLVAFAGENVDFLIVTAAGAPRPRASHRHEKCYCSDCYDYHEGCRCWADPAAEAAPTPSPAAMPFIQSCNCSPQEAGGMLMPFEFKYVVDFIPALTPCFPSESDWPENKSFFLTDLFAPPVFHPPEA